MVSSLRILLIEESPNNARPLLIDIEQAGYAVISRLVTGFDELHAALGDGDWDLALLCDSLPGLSAETALELLNNCRPALPVIVICAHFDEELAAGLIKAGASDCLPRERRARLLPVVERELAHARSHEESSRAADELRESEARYRVLFEYSPISLWEEDFSVVKLHLNSLEQAGVSDFRAYFKSHPAEVAELAGQVRVLDVNHVTLDLYQAANKELLLKNLDQIFLPEFISGFIDELVYIANGRRFFEWEGVNRTLGGNLLDVAVSWAAARGHEDDLSSVLVSVIDISQRKRDEKQLRQAEARLRIMVEQVPAIVYTESLDWPSELIYLSPQIEALTGFPAVEWVGVKNFWRSRIHPDDLAAFVQADDYATHSGERFQAEYRLISRDGRAVWVHDEAALVRDENNLPLFWQGILLDVSDRIIAEQALAESQMRFRSYFDLPLIGIAITSPEKGWIDVNQRLCDILGYSQQELAGMTWAELTHPDDMERDNEQFERVLAGEIQGYSLEKRFITRNGRAMWGSLAVRCVRKPDGVVDYFVAIIEDISARKQAEEEIERRLDELEALYQNSLAINRLLKPEQIARQVITTLEEKLHWHHASFRIFNPQTQQVELAAFSQPGSELDKTRTARLGNAITSSGAGLSAWVYENGQVVRCPQVKNDSRYFETHPSIQSGLYVPLRSGEHTIGTISVESEVEDAFSEQDERLLVTIASQAAISIESAQLYSQAQAEITARKQAEEELLLAHSRLEQRVVERTAELRNANLQLEKAARMKDEFLASMSHELRTPLTGILGLSEVMQLPGYGPLTEKQKIALGHINTSGKHLLDLINDILDLSKIEAGKLDLLLTTCSMSAICRSVLQMTAAQAAAKGLLAGLSMTPDTIRFKADERRIKQIIINLLGNAIKFTPQGGNFGIEALGSREDGQVHITVWDTGIGIKEEDQVRLFQSFVQLDGRLARQYSGTGLGLALVRRLAELHGGSVAVHSAPGQGSRFTVTLPWIE